MPSFCPLGALLIGIKSITFNSKGSLKFINSKSLKAKNTNYWQVVGNLSVVKCVRGGEKGVAYRGTGEGLENISVCGFGRPLLKAHEHHLHTALRLDLQFPDMLLTGRSCLLPCQQRGQPH